MPLDSESIRARFPALSRRVHDDVPLVYLDSAASAQKPQCVIDAVTECFNGHYSNVHRGLHVLSEEASTAYEAVRGKLAAFINAASPDEIIFTSGATAALNLIARSYGGANIRAGDEILISVADHHSNIVPWQMLAEARGAKVIAAPVNRDGSVALGEITKRIGKKTRIVAMPHVSNVLGTVFPIAEIARAAHAAGAVMVVDGCQGVVHLPVDVQSLGCDFYAFSGHKLYAPGGVGVLWGRGELLAAMPPFHGGGNMIDRVTVEESTYAPPPARFEAGTPAIAETIGLGAAIDFLQSIGMENIRDHESGLTAYAHQRLSAVKGLEIIGTAPGKSGVVSFTMDCAHPHDVSTIVDRRGVAVRAGHHCAKPLMDFLGLPATTRASLAVYTTAAEIDALGDALESVRRIFGDA